MALKQGMQPEFRMYQEQVMKNAKALGESLQGCDFNLVSGGTDNHLLLIDLRSKGVNGNKAEIVCENASIVLNKNTIPGDKSAMTPNGLRVGAPAMTSRGLVEEDFVQVGKFIGEAIDVAKEVQAISGPKLVDFRRVLKESPRLYRARLRDNKLLSDGDRSHPCRTFDMFCSGGIRPIRTVRQQLLVCHKKESPPGSLLKLKTDVEAFASRYDTIGF